MAIHMAAITTDIMIPIIISRSIITSHVIAIARGTIIIMMIAIIARGIVDIKSAITGGITAVIGE